MHPVSTLPKPQLCERHTTGPSTTPPGSQTRNLHVRDLSGPRVKPRREEQCRGVRCAGAGARPEHTHMLQQDLGHPRAKHLALRLCHYSGQSPA